MTIPSYGRLALPLAAAAVIVQGCGSNDRITDPDLQVSYARTATTGPTVTSTSPSSSVRGVTLNVRVLGSGFDRGTTAQWARDGVPSTRVVTNSTTYISSKELVANITIADDADVDYYDVIVTTASGKPGIGTESFEVVVEQIDLGTLGGYDSEATSINDAGQIVGGSKTSRSVTMPFLWQNGTMTSLGLPAGAVYGIAQEINNAAVVVGYAITDNHFTPWMWSASTGIVALPLPAGEKTGLAWALNDAGVIAGYVGETAVSRAALWNAGTLTEIHPLPGGSSEAISINEAGDVLGAYYPDEGGVLSFVRLASGEVRWLPCAAGAGCYGRQINDGRDVVGVVNDGTSSAAYRWTDAGAGAHGSIGEPGTYARGISDTGFMTGEFQFTIWDNTGAALWGSDGSMIPLQSESKRTAASGTAFDVNSSGWVVGYVEKNVKGRLVHRATRWRVPEV